MSEDRLKRLEEKIGYRFKDRDLLKHALTHSSSGNKYNYERLEFLGDRVLGLVIAHMLFDEFKDENEGGLAKRHAVLVQGRTLALIGSVHNLGEDILMSDSERISGGETKDNIIADSLEALLGALYLDGGLDSAKTVIMTLWGDNIHTLAEAPMDPKTELQEWVQARGLPLPMYDIISKSGPDHAPVFKVNLVVEDVAPIEAEGPSRRQAEKTAARKMLKFLKEEQA